MTAFELISSGCHNVHCKFSFDTGVEATGVIGTYFPDEPDSYYLVLTPNLRDFQELMKAKQYVQMKDLCHPVDLYSISTAKRL